jgi:hypothetical protein
MSKPGGVEKVLVRVIELDAKDKLRAEFIKQLERQQTLGSYQLSILDIGIETNERWSKDNYQLFIVYEYLEESLDRLLLSKRPIDQISATHLLYQGIKTINYLNLVQPGLIIDFSPKSVYRIDHENFKFNFNLDLQVGEFKKKVQG